MIIVDCINNDDSKNIMRLQRNFNCLGVTSMISLLTSGYSEYISIDYNNFIIFVDDIFEIYEFHLKKEQFDDIIEYMNKSLNWFLMRNNFQGYEFMIKKSIYDNENRNYGDNINNKEKR